jgi:hypothetical protein
MVVLQVMNNEMRVDNSVFVAAFALTTNLTLQWLMAIFRKVEGNNSRACSCLCLWLLSEKLVLMIQVSMVQKGFVELSATVLSRL